MPVIWRYLLGRYLKVLTLCLLSFVGILLIARMHEIAQFAALGGAWYYVLLFTAYQIPYIFPIALPISCLISAIILYQHMSDTQELTALRASGLSLRHITAPTLIAGAFLALFNFYLISEVTSYSRRATSRLEHEVRSLSPLLLLQNRNFIQHRSAYVDVKGPIQSGESAEDVILALNQGDSERITLVLTKKFASAEDVLSAESVSIVSGADGKEDLGFDHLFLENLGDVKAPLSDFSYFIKKGGWRVKNDYFEFSLLMIRLRKAIVAVREARVDPLVKEADLRELKDKRNACLAEVSRRFSVGLAVFTFSLMGCSFGVRISRNRSSKGVLMVSALALLFLVCFFVAKGLPERFLLATVLYLVPHVVISTLSIRALRRATRGVE